MAQTRPLPPLHPLEDMLKEGERGRERVREIEGQVLGMRDCMCKSQSEYPRVLIDVGVGGGPGGGEGYAATLKRQEPHLNFLPMILLVTGDDCCAVKEERRPTRSTIKKRMQMSNSFSSLSLRGLCRRR